MADRNFAAAEKILEADPQPAFEADSQKFACRAFVLGWIEKCKGDEDSAKVAFENSRPQQLAYVQRWPDDPNPLMMLAFNDAALGHKDDALNEAHRAIALRPISQDAVDGPLFAFDLAHVFLWAGEPQLALQQLESLAQVPRALTYGDLSMPEWAPIRSDPRFQKLFSQLKPIPIMNRSDKARD